MPGNRSRSPLGLRQRRVAEEARAPDTPIFSDKICFPRAYDEAWGNENDRTFDLSPIERARIFLLRMLNRDFDPVTITQVRTIIQDRTNNTIPAIAAAIQQRVFGDRHSSFYVCPLLQIVRFMLLKSRVQENVYSDRTRAVIDFYFDPTIHRNIVPLPAGDYTVYQYPAGRLKVVIVGGGPTALASAISLAEKGKGKVAVHMYERRWIQKKGPDGKIYVDYPKTARRRDQVVTLQDSVTRLLSAESYKALFGGSPERVWPGSANIQIRKVEDRFLKRVQDPEFHDTIYLHTEGVTREDVAKVGDFHVILGADGAASWVRKSYFNGYENERGRSYALGLAFDRPEGLPWPQSLNVFLTLGQTRYLLNASDHDGRGYLNMQLTEEEWDQMRSIDGQFVHFGRPGCLRLPDGSVPAGFHEDQVFAPSEHRESPLWQSIEDGLKLFGFKESEVINIVRIPIVVQAVREGVQELPAEDSISIRRPHALVAVAGDAAMTVHFWPGRGLNSGIKSGLALGDELVEALKGGKFVGMPLSAMKEYNDFILKLQTREHDNRSIPILNQSGTPEMLGWLLEKAASVPDKVATEWLIGAMLQIAERLEGRPDWPFPKVENPEPQLRIILRQLNSLTLREMAVSFPWPTREMAGAEVLPVRSMEKEEKKTWLQDMWGKMNAGHKVARTRAASPFRRGSGDEEGRGRVGRFEAPRLSRGFSPVPRSLRFSSQTSGDTRVRSESISTTSTPSTTSDGSDSLLIPLRSRTNSLAMEEADEPRARSISPAGSMSLGRMLTIHKRPPPNVLGDALSLALFRVDATVRK